MLKNPKKADLNKDGKLSGYEKKRGMAIEKSMAAQDKGKSMEDKRSNFMGGGIAYAGGGRAMKREMYGMGSKKPKPIKAKGPGVIRPKPKDRYGQVLKTRPIGKK